MWTRNEAKRRGGGVERLFLLRVRVILIGGGMCVNCETVSGPERGDIWRRTPFQRTKEKSEI